MGARDDLLARIVDDVAEHGIGDRSLRHLAESVGSSHRMLHYHFGSREGLVAAIVDEVEGRQRGALAEVLECGGEGVTDVQRLTVGLRALAQAKPELLKATRKRRIASGAGAQVQDVNRLLNQFEQMRDVMKKMKGGGMMKMMKRMGAMKGLGGMR